MTHQAILAYNEQLIKVNGNGNGNCDILEYIRRINSMHKEPIDLSFMEDLLSFIEQNECCIPHTLLIKYGVFKENNASAHISDTLKLYEMISDSDICIHNVAYKECETCKYDTDFKLSNVRELESNGKHYNKIIYILKPDTFKFILMRSKCERKYAKYYILLEKCIKYYHDYQIACKEYILSQKDTKIDNLSKELAEIKAINLAQITEMANQSINIQALLGYAKDTQEDLSSMLNVTIEQVEQTEVAVIDRVNAPPNKCDIEQLVVFEKDSTLYTIRGTMSYVSIKCKQLCGKSLIKIIKDGNINVKEINFEYTYLKYYKDVPNARHLYRVVKNQLGAQVETNLNTITIKEPTLSIEFVLDKIQMIFEQRLTVDISEVTKKVVKPKVDKKITSIKSNSKTLK